MTTLARYNGLVTFPPSDNQLRAWRNLMLVHGEVVERLEADLASADKLPLAWYEALVTLRLAGGGMRMHELAKEMTLTRSAATRFVDRLEEAGLVERTLCETDRRGMTVTLTKAGQLAQERAAPVALNGLRQHFARHLTEEQAAAIAAALEAVLVGEGRLRT